MCVVHSPLKLKLGKPLLIKCDSESFSEPSTDTVACIGMNDKHSIKQP